MNIIDKENLVKNLSYFLKGNIDAMRLIIDIFDLIHIWDDLVDKDKERTSDEINNAFRIALIDIPLNPFYQRYQGHLIPLIMNCILQWEDANEMEKMGDSDKHQAFMLRASVIQLISYCAFLIGGMEWSRQVGTNIRKMYIEQLDKFMEEMKCQI